MVTSTLTDKKIEAGKNLVQAADSSGLNIDAALWVYSQDQESWKLMLSIKGIEKIGPKKYYNKIQKLIAKQQLGEKLTLSEIALAKPKSPLLDLMRVMVKTAPRPGICGINFSGNVVNGQLLPDSYIYRLS